jgi:hypothetical protein
LCICAIELVADALINDFRKFFVLVCLCYFCVFFGNF